MRRREITLLLLLLAGIAFWLTSQWWLPPILAQLPSLEKRAVLIQAIEALVSLAVLGMNVLIGYLFWVSRKETQKTERDRYERPLAPTSPAVIRQKMGSGGRVTWIDRQATSTGRLREYGGIAIIGPSRQGKTREASELIERMIELDLVNDDCIYEPGNGFDILEGAGLQVAVREQVDTTQAALFFVDDLSRRFTETASLGKLSVVLAELSHCKQRYVIMTARSDQLSEAQRSWLVEQGIEECPVPDLDEKECATLASNGAKNLGLVLDDDARDVLIERNDGTPDLPLMALRLLRAEGVTTVDKPLAERAMQRSAADAWAETRRYILATEPSAQFILNALVDFHAAGVRKAVSLVLPFAAQKWTEADGRPRRQLRRLRKSLNYPGRFEIVVIDNVITAPDPVVEQPCNHTMARSRVERFLIGHHRFRHTHWPGHNSQAADAQRWALFDLALGYGELGEPDASQHIYTAALRIRPHFSFYNNRGLARYDQGDLSNAIVDFDQAIILNPNDAIAYNNRGLARRAQGDLDDAIADFDQAIILNPDATAYNNRGSARKAQGDLDNAIADYQQYLDLGGGRRDGVQGEVEEIIRSLRKQESTAVTGDETE